MIARCAMRNALCANGVTTSGRDSVPKPAASRIAHPRTRASRGFTLLEVLVVLTLVAITAAAAVPAFLADREQGAEREVATALATALARVRDGARSSAAPATLVLSPRDARMWLVWRDSIATEQLALAPGIELAAAQSDRVQCRFEPTGTATPCEVTIRGRASVPVRVDAWTGEITIGDGAPL
jgi:prepilin-type N-terminal cleavage/methylation domain-containing protein